MIKIFDSKNINDAEICSRYLDDNTPIEQSVEAIIKEVRLNGDKALIDYAKKFDNATLSSILVSEQEIAEALQMVDKELIEIIKQSAQNIYDFHVKQVESDFVLNTGHSFRAKNHSHCKRWAICSRWHSSLPIKRFNECSSG